MSASPLVSVFMPTYNQAPFVGDAIRSAAEQDYPNLEIVVGDDGSTDETFEVVQELAREFEDRVIPLAHRDHVGIASNFNRTLAACRGEYVAFFAGDDLYLPGKISAQVAWLEADARRVLCGHDVEVFDSVTGRTMYRWSSIQPMLAGHDAALFVRYGNLYHPLGNMVRRSALPLRGYDSRLPILNDWKLFVDCVAPGGAFGFVAGVYARYRQWPGNVSKREREMFQDLIATLELIEREYPWLVPACRARRADALFHRGSTLLRRGAVGESRRVLRESFSAMPSSRAALALALSVAPPRAVRAAAQMIQHARRLGKRRDNAAVARAG